MFELVVIISLEADADDPNAEADDWVFEFVMGTMLESDTDEPDAEEANAEANEADE